MTAAPRDDDVSPRGTTPRDPPAPTANQAGYLGGAIRLGNEFAEVRVRLAATRNGARLVIESVRTGRSISLCPLEVEALTRQNTATFSAMIANPFGPLVAEEPAGELGAGQEAP